LVKTIVTFFLADSFVLLDLLSSDAGRPGRRSSRVNRVYVGSYFLIKLDLSTRQTKKKEWRILCIRLISEATLSK